MAKMERREHVNPKRGEREYGDVEFADPVNSTYRIDTDEHIRAAWSYIDHRDNAAKYEASEVGTIKQRIMRTANDHGIEIDPETVDQDFAWINRRHTSPG